MEEWKRNFVRKLAERIRRSGFETPALLMLEAHRPLLRLGGHFLAVTEPVAAGLVGLERVRKWRDILFDAEAVELLARRLEGEEGDDEPASSD